MDDIEERLRDTSESCFNCYQKWHGNKRDGKLRGDLEDAVHELRKTASRIEIEIAVSEGGSSTNTMKAPNQRNSNGKPSNKPKPQEPKGGSVDDIEAEAPKKVVLKKKSASAE